MLRKVASIMSYMFDCDIREEEVVVVNNEYYLENMLKTKVVVVSCEKVSDLDEVNIVIEYYEKWENWELCEKCEYRVNNKEEIVWCNII